MTERQDKITIYGPKADGTYIVEFKTAEDETLAISVPGSEAAVLKRDRPAPALNPAENRMR